MTALCHLLEEARQPASVVARRFDSTTRTDRDISWQDFQGHVSDLRSRLASEPDGPWVLLTQDAYTFAVGLLALWHSGRHAISPPNHQSGALSTLQARAAGVLCDRPDWFPTTSCIDPLSDFANTGPAPHSFSPLDPEAPAIELYTSGTTGAEKPVVKRIRHLQEELRELGATWDDLLGDACVFATASHQHLYGLLFGVLWPLCAERTFQTRHLLHAGELIPRLRATEAKQGWALAGVPTHLRRFVRQLPGESLAASCRVIFSSGGPLDTETAHRIADELGRPPLEVLGSSETGGIAWRAQHRDESENLWKPFPSVRIAAETSSGALRVKSPFVSVDMGSAGFATGDLVALQTDGRFALEGRSTRIVKIGEKRLDLGAMESQLRAHPWISEVALGTLGRDSDPRVVGVAIPSRLGWEQIRLSGRRPFVDGLRADLAKDWDPVLHPRYWRTVCALPENEQGKVSLKALERLFENPESHGNSDRPAVTEEVRGDDFIERSCFVPQDLSCFAGHFPGRPVVPGVLQLDWALEAAADWRGPIRVEEIESLKLLGTLSPGARFQLRVGASAEARLQFRIWSADQEFAKGRVRLSLSDGPGGES